MGLLGVDSKEVGFVSMYGGRCSHQVSIPRQGVGRPCRDITHEQEGGHEFAVAVEWGGGGRRLSYDTGGKSTAVQQ